MGKKFSDDISEEDHLLFKEAVSKIKKMAQNRVILKKKSPSPTRKQFDTENVEPAFTISDFQTEKTVSSDDYLFFARPGLSEKQIRELRQGKFRISARLDLHGFNIETARDELISFIHTKFNQKQRYLCIIHGKGHGEQPILKNKLNNWLRQIDQILAFATATPRHGGAGALYVLLKSGKK